MQPYELCALLAGSITPAEIEEHVKKIAQFLADAKAEVAFTHAIGRKKLAYTINGQTHGEYMVWLFRAESSAVQPLNDKLRLAPFVVRHVINKLEAVSIDERIIGMQDAKAGKSVAREEAVELKEEEKELETHRRGAFSIKPAAAPRAAVSPSEHKSEHKKEEKKVSLEELDKKLDEILESDKL